MARRSIILHIGTHVTGTTSLQDVLHKSHRELAIADIAFYPGAINVSNHVELHMASMRPDRASPIKQALPLTIDDAFRADVTNHVKTFLRLNQSERVIFSAEGLSYLRYPDEIAFLQNLFEDCDVRVVVYLRERSAFLASYGKKMVQEGHALSSDPTHFAFTREGSWLTDYDALINAYAAGFGQDAITIRDYDADQSEFGGTVASFLHLLDLPPSIRNSLGEPRLKIFAGLRKLRRSQDN